MIWDTSGNLIGAWRTDGTQVWTGGGEVVMPPLGPDRNVATMCSAGIIARTPAVANGTYGSTDHALAVDVDGVVLEWVITNGYIAPEEGGVLRAAVQAGDGPTWTVTFSGSQTHRIDPAASGGSVVITSDPVPVKASAGEALNVLAWVDPDGTGTVPADGTSLLATDPGKGGGAWTVTPSLTPSTDPGGQTSSGGAWTLRPSRVVAPSDQPAWVAVGDSIVQQTWSWPERALSARPAVKVGVGGDAYIYYESGSAFQNRIGAHLAHADMVLDEFGINDTGTTDDGLVIAARALGYWRQVEAAGVGIVKTTVTLAVSTSDNWATLEGQTTGAQEPGRVAFNTWLRDGAPLAPDGTAPVAAGTTQAIRCTTVDAAGTVTVGGEGHPLTAVTDVVAAIESSPDSGKYALGAPSAAMSGWDDGLHPSPGIHAILGDRLARDLELLGF